MLYLETGNIGSMTIHNSYHPANYELSSHFHDRQLAIIRAKSSVRLTEVW